MSEISPIFFPTHFCLFFLFFLSLCIFFFSSNKKTSDKQQHVYFSVFEKLWSRPSKLTSAYWAVWDLAVVQIMLPASAASLPGTTTAAARINYTDSLQNAVLQAVCLQLHSSPSSCWCLLAYPNPRKVMLESFDSFHWFRYHSISMLHDRYIRNAQISLSVLL